MGKNGMEGSGLGILKFKSVKRKICPISVLRTCLKCTYKGKDERKSCKAGWLNINEEIS